MNEKSPVVSIILPTYNRAHLIAETIQSVLDQTFANWELLVADDGSTDRTDAVVASFSDSRIVYLKLDHSGYIGRVRNVAIKRSTGTLIAFIDSDDLWKPNKLQVQVALLNEYPSAKVVIGNGDEFGAYAIQTPEYKSLFVGSLFLPILEREDFCFYFSTFMFAREVIDATGMFDESVPTACDIHLFYEISQRFDGIFTNAKLVSIRKHDQNISLGNGVLAYTNTLRMLERFVATRRIGRTLFHRLAARFNYRTGLFYLRHHQPEIAFRHFLRSLRHRPISYKGYARAGQSGLTAIRKLFF